MSSSSRWRGSISPPRPSLPSLLLAVSLVLAFGPLRVEAANETDAQNAQDTSATLKAAALKQGTDGGSGAMGFVWAAFCILIALPLLTAGLKLMRFTCGAGLGLVLCFVVWVSFANSSPTNGFASTPFLSDVLITIPTLVLSALALGLGLFRPARYVGHNLLCMAGGIAFVLQLMLFREGLLIPIREVIWGLVGLAAILGLVLGVGRQRIGVLSMSSMVGSFLLSLGVDLIVNKQQGMSFALRVIFDDNDAHKTLLVRTNYKPTLSTQIILGSGLAVAIAASVAQHFLYPGDFIKRPLSKQWSSLLAPPSEQAANRSTKFYAEDLEPGAVSPPDEAYIRPWERNKSGEGGGGVGIASSEPYFDQQPQMSQRQTLEQQRRYEEEQRVIYEPQQRFAAERQAFGGGGGLGPREIATHQPSPAVSNRTLTPEFFDPSSTLMRPPTALRPVNNQQPPQSPLHSQGAPPPSASRPRPAQQQEVPWQQQQQQQQSRLAQSQQQQGGGRLNTPSAPDRSTNSSPSSVYSTRGDTLPPGSKIDLLNAVQKLYGATDQQQGKDRPLADASGGGGGSGKRYEPPSARSRYV